MNSRDGSLEWPALERYSDMPMFNTKAVVQQTGVPASTLRAWERRYALIAPGRADNAYRLYSERDIALIHWLKERIDTGVTISQAAALFRHMQEEHEQQSSNDEQAFTVLEKEGERIPHFQIAISSSLPMKEEDEPLSSLQEWPQLRSEPVRGGYALTHNMRVAQERLIETFRNLDEPMAHMIMGSILSIHPVEQVCTQLILPTLQEVGELWAGEHLTVPEEHFASNFFRALLTNLFHVTPGPLSGPYTFVCCAPGEPHELGALMLALFLRRRNVRIAYLGQSIETKGMIRVIRKLSPVLVCVSLTMPAYLPALLTLAQQIQRLTTPRPTFAFGGQVFALPQYGNSVSQIPGIYMHGDLSNVADVLCRMVLEFSENKN